MARLAEVTQVRTIDGGYLVHNRLTHSLKVAQLARRITEKLKSEQPQLAARLQLDEDVAEAAGLAHDMGHPPFGHIAEEELNTLVKDNGVPDGYEGNAQTFRILQTLTVGDPIADKETAFLPGLNLTRATLNAVLKYPWLHLENVKKPKKWGCYATERDAFEWARDGAQKNIRTTEAEIMDWADDITYAIHDMIDFHCAGLIPLHLLANNGETGGDLRRKEIESFFESAFKRLPELEANAEAYKTAFHAALSVAAVSSPYIGTQTQNRDLWYYSSVLISSYLDAIELIDPQASDSNGLSVRIKETAGHQTTILKELTWKYVILHHDLATIQFGQKKMIRELFGIFLASIKENRLQMFPRGFAQMIEDSPHIPAARWTADYISGLTERDVRHLHHRLSGA